MASSGDYGRVRLGRLKLKGGKSIPKGSKRPEDGTTETAGVSRKKPKMDEAKAADLQDQADHGGWWKITQESAVKSGLVAIETAPNTYVMTLDDGNFTLGVPHPLGEEPHKEEIFTLFKSPDANWVSLKSGYDKYLSIDKKGLLMANSDAVGPKEQWQVVFEEGKSALLAPNNYFLSFELDSEGFMAAQAQRVGETEVIQLRTSNEREKPVDWVPAEDKIKDDLQCEITYVKKFQNWQDHRLRLNPGDKTEIKAAKHEGTLHQVLLDRREKMKADRYCK